MKKWLFCFMLLLLTALYTQQARAQKQSHKEYSAMKIAECNDCHKGEGIAPNHDADWLRGHRALAGKAGGNCAQCHKQSFCMDCHFGGGIDANLEKNTFKQDYIPRSHRSDFISIHPIKSQDNPQTCYRCHDKSYCNECHARFPKGSLRIKSHLRSGSGQTYIWSSDHATEARRNLQSCQTCHPEGDVCITCHSAKAGAKINPHPKSFKGNSIKDRSDRSCTKCHFLR